MVKFALFALVVASFSLGFTVCFLFVTLAR